MITTRAIILILSIIIAWVACLKVRQRSVFFRVLFILLCAALVTEVYGIISNQLGLHNNLVYNGFFLFDGFCFLYLANYMRQIHKGVLIGTAAVIAIAMGISAGINPIHSSLLTEGILLTGACISVLSLFVLYRIASTNQQPLLHIPHFWFFLSALIYFGGILPFLGAEQLAHELDHSWAQILYNVVIVSAVVRYGLIAYSCILENRTLEKQSWNHVSN